MHILRVLLFLALLPPENELELSRILPIALAGVLQVDFPDYTEKQEKKVLKTSYPPPLKAIVGLAFKVRHTRKWVWYQISLK